MITSIKGSTEKVIALEIIGGYQTIDEKSIERLFEEKLAIGLKQVNLLVKIDQLSLTKSSWKAMWDDGMYALKHIKNCGRIAIVGDSKVEDFLIKIDNAFFGNKKAGREEKYFQLTDMNKAMEWVNR